MSIQIILFYDWSAQHAHASCVASAALPTCSVYICLHRAQCVVLRPLVSITHVTVQRRFAKSCQADVPVNCVASDMRLSRDKRSTEIAGGLVIPAQTQITVINLQHFWHKLRRDWATQFVCSTKIKGLIMVWLVGSKFSWKTADGDDKWYCARPDTRFV